MRRRERPTARHWLLNLRDRPDKRRSRPPAAQEIQARSRRSGRSGGPFGFSTLYHGNFGGRWDSVHGDWLMPDRQTRLLAGAGTRPFGPNAQVMNSAEVEGRDHRFVCPASCAITSGDDWTTRRSKNFQLHRKAFARAAESQNRRPRGFLTCSAAADASGSFGRSYFFATRLPPTAGRALFTIAWMDRVLHRQACAKKSAPHGKKQA